MPRPGLFLALFVAGLLSLATWVRAEPFPALYDVVDVALDDLLNVREAPSGAAPIVTRLLPTARNIEVLRTSEDGRWAQVGLREGGGWVSLRYMRRLGGQGWRDLPERLNCSGTEPFWSLEYRGSGRTDLRTPYGPDRNALLREIEAAPNDLRAFGTIGTLQAGGSISLSMRRQACSDGMSDRPFGISALIILADRDGQSVQAGCCSLR